jgi:hypothetical protein
MATFDGQTYLVLLFAPLITFYSFYEISRQLNLDSEFDPQAIPSNTNKAL